MSYHRLNNICINRIGTPADWFIRGWHYWRFKLLKEKSNCCTKKGLVGWSRVSLLSRTYIYMYTYIHTYRHIFFALQQTNMWLAETPPFPIGTIYTSIVSCCFFSRIGVRWIKLLRRAFFCCHQALAWHLRCIHVDGSQRIWFNLHPRREYR